MMQDLKCCVRYKGKVYCWDAANERIVSVVISDMELSECPERVMQLIMKHLKDSGNEDK